MNTNEAKKIVQAALNQQGITGTKLKAKTLNFTDLARASCVFVTVCNYPFDGSEGRNTQFWHKTLKPLAVEHGFRIE